MIAPEQQRLIDRHLLVKCKRLIVALKKCKRLHKTAHIERNYRDRVLLRSNLRFTCSWGDDNELNCGSLTELYIELFYMAADMHKKARLILSVLNASGEFPTIF